MKAFKKICRRGVLLTCLSCAVLLVQFNIYGNDFVQQQDLAALQKEIMAKLTGNAEISPGITIPNRNTPENRVIARQYIFELFEEFGYKPVAIVYRYLHIDSRLRATLNCIKA